MNNCTRPEDQEFQKKHNLNQDEFEYYIERMGFRVEDAGMNENQAKILTLIEIKEMRNV